MRVVIQRVSEANLTIDAEIFSSIEQGLVVLVGICEEDTLDDVEWLANKISGLRLFPDQEGKMNLSVMDVSGELLLVSQFTLFASTKKGTRPSFIKAANPELAMSLYEKLINVFQQKMGSESIKTGVFGADMKVALVNDGPVTITIDSKNKE